ncbi:MAG: hydrogenase 3 maturation endopeptidase HyCI [Firmicutes bacterium]|nr:hydrogenase 3 maturation endopeptidase HyCI [Bacillota bacterium]
MEKLKSAFDVSDRIVILGIGSELRGDDGAGVMAASLLEKKLNGRAKDRVKIISGATAPENLTGEVKSFQPDLILFMDAADMCHEPGEFLVFTPEETDNITFSTHTLPIRVMADYLKVYLQCEVLIAGIQPKQLNFDSPVTPEVEAGVARLVDTMESWI